MVNQLEEPSTERRIIASFQIWQEKETQSVNAWGKYFLERLDDGDIPVGLSLLGVGKSEITTDKVSLTYDGTVGPQEDWVFLKPIHDSRSTAALIGSSFQELGPMVDALALKLGLDSDLVLDAVVKTQALLDNTRFKNLPLGQLEFRQATLDLSNSLRNLRLTRFSSMILDEAGRGVLGGIEYYSLIIIKNRLCRSPIFAYNLAEIDFKNIFQLVLFLNSHAEVGDQYQALLAQPKEPQPSS